jgi:hypothetical protein
MVLSISTLLGAMGIAILAYRSLGNLWGDLRRSVWDIAWSCSVHEASGHIAYTGGEVYGIDWQQLRALLRRRVDAHIWMVLGIVSTGVSLAVLAMPRAGYGPAGAADRALALGVVAGLLIVLMFTVGYRHAWRWLRERWWFAHVWLTWLERQVADPLAVNVNPSQDLVLVVYHIRHPDLQRFLDKRWAGEHGQPLTIEDRQAIEHWIASFAKRWKHRFGSAAWQRWQSQTLAGETAAQ